ncbi:hypothetical protein [Natrinema sp. H-ect4]|uniref:hypothetical protein n=1 Tax=Natrinema sp. H-ect4 TaxID=3242699 RepID=UPI0035A95D8B
MSTGAFTTASAEREVNVSTAGDGSAFLTLTGDGDYVSDESGDTLTLDLGGPDGNDDATGFNQEAVTTLTGVVTITNNAAEDTSTTVGVSTDPAGSAEAGGSASLQVPSGDPEAVVTFYVSDEEEESSVGEGETRSIDTGESAYLDVEIDTRDDTLGDTDASDDDSLTIVAE